MLCNPAPFWGMWSIDTAQELLSSAQTHSESGQGGGGGGGKAGAMVGETPPLLDMYIPFLPPTCHQGCEVLSDSWCPVLAPCDAMPPVLCLQGLA